ncbi:hypothetical protein FWC63_02240 [Candidatus Saccharibacteria bacterium]|nr:hypothetical protein [Candidatus Saccharibacteria bacterium]
MAQKRYSPIEPRRCSVGDRQKIIYPTELEAEVAARNAEIDHNLPVNTLDYYKCEFGDHFHLRHAHSIQKPNNH